MDHPVRGSSVLEISAIVVDRGIVSYASLHALRSPVSSSSAKLLERKVL